MSEIARESRCGNLYTKSGRFIVFRNIVFQLISSCSRMCYQDRGRICRILITDKIGEKFD